MFKTLMTPFTWLNEKRKQFNDWVYRQLPGWKTHITAWTMIAGDAVYLLKDTIDAIPMDIVHHYVTGDTIIMFNLVMTILVIWFRKLGNRG